MIVGHAARLVMVLSLLWSAGCVVAAVNWHSNWSGFVAAGAADGEVAAQAHARLWHWIEMALLGLAVSAAALVLLFWRAWSDDAPDPDAD